MNAVQTKREENRVIALAGNPNVGKSTVFNGLTGMRQHTGNWPGKTVLSAIGYCTFDNRKYQFVDLPGTYSLSAHSAEEEIARDFICFKSPDLIIVFCDGTCLERNLNLVLQTLEITNRVLVCVNLMDEAKKKHIRINFKLLEEALGVPVIGMNARNKNDRIKLMQKISTILDSDCFGEHKPVIHSESIENAIKELEFILQDFLPIHMNSRWIATKVLECDETFLNSFSHNINIDLNHNEELLHKRKKIYEALDYQGISYEFCRDVLVSDILLRANKISKEVVRYDKIHYDEKDRFIDRILTGKHTGLPVMILLLLIVFWITITGANYPSQLLFHLFFIIEKELMNFTTFLGVPIILQGILIQGAFRVLAWVVAVMLPPMAIFFPLFTILEDLGYLPRIAFNLDHHFLKACACGKQALTMCLGFGCNAVGVTGCRIIDSPRERLIAIITNNFVPCNGRFPSLLSLISMFFVSSYVTKNSEVSLLADSQNKVLYGLLPSLFSSLILTAVIVLGIVMTFLVSRILSKTLLKGVPSSFTLELPPYRRPQIGKIIVRSIFNRTLFVLARAIIIAAPAGLIIWSFANFYIGEATLLTYCTNFLNPLGKLMGLDGVILMGFILGFPANEIVLPIILMTYMANGSIVAFENLNEMKELLTGHGWTWLTALCMILFSLMHWPCSTTCLTIKKETGSLKWTVLSFIIPTAIGITICTLVATFARLVMYIL